MPVIGTETVQFASPGAQLGLSVSPGAYGLAGGLALTRIAKPSTNANTHATKRKILKRELDIPYDCSTWNAAEVWIT